MFGTRAGWLDGHEVTEVCYDPAVLPFADLLAHGVHAECAQLVWTTTADQAKAAHAAVGDRAHALAAAPRPDKEPKYYLLQTDWRHVPMTPAQAARCNAALAPDSKDHDLARWLSPRQLALHARIAAAPDAKWPLAVDVPIAEAWAHLHDRGR